MIKPVPNVSGLCAVAGHSRQAFYQVKHARQAATEGAKTLCALVLAERQVQPRLGVRKLRHLVAPALAAAKVKIGRDKCFNILRDNNLLVPRRRRYARTTDSNHAWRTYPDLYNHEPRPTAPHQTWVADITYVSTGEGFLYLALITDVFSRKIVGYDSADTLEATGCLRALTMAQKQLPKKVSVLHHTDRGSQYCCKDYIAQLNDRGARISMTQDGNCYPNALAERMNGILKQEYQLGSYFPTKDLALGAVHQGVYLYNHRRPHLALDLRTPAQAHRPTPARTTAA